MTVREKVVAALKPCGIPVYFGGWKAGKNQELPPSKYAVFTTMKKHGAFSDNRHQEETWFIYLNLYAKGNFEKDLAEIEDCLLKNDFALESEVDAYLQEGDIHHVASTWVYRVSL